MFCKKCGTQIPDNAKFCPKCGEMLTREPKQQSTQHQGPRQSQQQKPASRPTQQKNGSCYAALALSIVGIVLAFCTFGTWVVTYELAVSVIGLILSIVSIIVAGVSFKKNAGIAAISLILGIIAFIILIRTIVYIGAVYF